MKDFNNLYTIQGVIYAKPVRYVPDKKNKNNGVPWEFPSIILEVKRMNQGKEYVELPEFDMGKGVTTEGFEIGDRVEITFSLSGREIEYKNKEGEKVKMHKTAPKALYLKHADRQGNDTRDVSIVYKPKDDFTPPPLPYSEESDADEGSDLPFIFTIPIALGILSQLMF